MGKSRILFVEDDNILNITTRDSLEELGFEMRCVHSGPAAMAALDRLEYITALLTDIDLGGGPDGFDVARYARKLYRRLPVVFVSGSMAAHVEAHGVEGSIFVPKPFQAHQIVEALERGIRLEAA